MRYRPAKVVFIVFFLAPALLWVQEQKNQWYFGEYAAIDFNGPTPTPLSNSAMNSINPCASISDNNGNLLFYCDTMIWNAQHQPMLNGNGLNSSISSSQACLILPKPGNIDKYIIITTPDYWPVSGHINEAYWNEVDMSLDGGSGAVTQKNIFLMDSSSQKLTATLHENGTDYWVLMHRMGSNSFVAYLLTASGFTTNPVYSNIGSNYSEWVYSNGDGWMHFSNDGAKLANGHRWQDEVELFDFDNATGQLSNRILLSELEPYGIEFSPNGQFIYCALRADIGVNSKLIQFDISSGDSAQISASRTLLYESPNPQNEIVYSIVQAPDSKLYVSIDDAEALGVTDQPDLPGISCNYMHNSFQLVPGTYSRVGLPNHTKQYGETIDAIDEESELVSLAVFPIPANNMIYIEIPENWKDHLLQLKLFDQQGRLLRNVEFTFAKQLVIERNDLESGVYQGAIYANRELAGVFRVVFE